MTIDFTDSSLFSGQPMEYHAALYDKGLWKGGNFSC